MDSAKLGKFKEVHWQPARCCKGCKYGSFGGNSDWGLCRHPGNTYFHNKHKRLHELPSHCAAVCDKFEPGETSTRIKVFLQTKVTS